MTVRDTSIAAYIELRCTGIDGQVYTALRQHPGVRTRREVASLLRMQASTVSGAVNRLMKRGLVVENGTRECQVTGKRVNRIEPTEVRTVRNRTFILVPVENPNHTRCRSCAGDMSTLCYELGSCHTGYLKEIK